MAVSNPQPPPNEIRSVTDLTREIKGLLEPAFPMVWVRGEISNLRRQPSGHAYFSLKDEKAQISGVCFRREAGALPITLKNGLQVIGMGRISVYEPRGNYQIIFQLLLEDGIGRLQQQFEALKQKLNAEGLFAPERKSPIPTFPKTVGFVTSSTGAALRDFVSILRRRRWPGRLIVIPSRVQGREAAPELVRGIELTNEHNLCDLLVIGRGGGSLEDIWPFNEESVCRAVADSRIPVISAVGHEIDFVLSDFAADQRAETPSAAAELISSTFVDLRKRYQQACVSLDETIDYLFEKSRYRLDLAGSRLQRNRPESRLENARLRLDDWQSRLNQCLQNRLHRESLKLRELSNRLHRASPERHMAIMSERISQLKHRLRNASPEATLNRGYAMVLDKEGNVIPSVTSLAKDAQVTTRFRDGKRDMQVLD